MPHGNHQAIQPHMTKSERVKEQLTVEQATEARGGQDSGSDAPLTVAFLDRSHIHGVMKYGDYSSQKKVVSGWGEHCKSYLREWVNS